jgi:hypothetical protein
MTGRAPFRGRYGRLRLRGPRSRSASPLMPGPPVRACRSASPACRPISRGLFLLFVGGGLGARTFGAYSTGRVLAPRLRPANVPFGPLPVFRHSGVVRQAASSLKRGASAGSAFVSSLGGSPAAFAAAMRPFMGPPTTGDPRRSGGFLAAAYGARQKLR